MFWSLVRPDRILPPITRSAAVTTSLEADELAVGMITCELFKGQDSWSSTPDQRRASALRTAGRFIGLLWAGGGSKKEGAYRPGRNGDLRLQPILFSIMGACKNATPLTRWKTRVRRLLLWRFFGVEN